MAVMVRGEDERGRWIEGGEVAQAVESVDGRPSEDHGPESKWPASDQATGLSGKGPAGPVGVVLGPEFVWGLGNGHPVGNRGREIRETAPAEWSQAETGQPLERADQPLQAAGEVGSLHG